MTTSIATRGLRKGALALVSAGVLLASVVPSAAVGMPPRPAPVDTAQSRADRGPRADMMALADQPFEQAVAYCESRFRSYDRVTGTYLGHDGNEHLCP